MATASFRTAFGGASGFEELRKYIKQGGDFCKEVVLVMQERAELESSYSKGLLKLSNKIAKSSKDVLGTSGCIWKEIALNMEQEADIHKSLSTSLLEDIVKQLKNLVDTHHKHRKVIESPVDKAFKVLSECRSDETKAKKLSFASCKDNERMQDQPLDNRSHKGKVLTEKDVNKLTIKRKKAQEGLQKADQDYYKACLKAERSRQEWETAVFRASEQLQHLEEEKLHYMQDLVQKYSNHLNVLGPNTIHNSERLNEAVGTFDVRADMRLILECKGTGPYIAEQTLPDFYAEDIKQPMKRERRKYALDKLQMMMQHDMDLEKRAGEGLQNLSRGIRSAPNFGNADAQQDVDDKMKHIEVTMIYLDVSCFKVQSALADLEGRQRPTHHLSGQIEQRKDKQGILHTVLKLPTSTGHEQRFSVRSESSEWGANIPSPIDGPPPAYNNVMRSNSRRCRAIYLYEANMEDELTIRPGDVITLHERSNDEWWKGELNGRVGVFPAAYVEDIT